MAENHAEVFREEAFELLSELESSLLALEENPDDADIVGRVFRAMHTIKGSGAMFGFDTVARFTHEVETVFDLVRKGEMAVTKPLIDATLAARDRIRAMLDAPPGEAEAPGDRAETDALVARFRAFVPARPDALAPPEAPKPEAPEKADAEIRDVVTYRIRFRPPADLFRCGTNPVSLINELRGLGDLRVVAMTEGIPPLEEADPERCYMAWDMILTTEREENAIRDVFIFVDEPGALAVDVIDSSGNHPSEADYKKLGDILMERGDLVDGKLRQALGRQKRLGELLVESGVVTPSQVKSALLEQKVVKEQREKRQAAENAASVRVPAERLDTLVNLVGKHFRLLDRRHLKNVVRRDPFEQAVGGLLQYARPRKR